MKMLNTINLAQEKIKMSRYTILETYKVMELIQYAFSCRDNFEVTDADISFDVGQFQIKAGESQIDITVQALELDKSIFRAVDLCQPKNEPIISENVYSFVRKLTESIGTKK